MCEVLKEESETWPLLALSRSIPKYGRTGGELDCPTGLNNFYLLNPCFFIEFEKFKKKLCYLSYTIYNGSINQEIDILYKSYIIYVIKND